MTHAEQLLNIELKIKAINELKSKPVYNSYNERTKARIDGLLNELTNNKFNIIKEMHKTDDSYLWSLMMAM